MLKKKSILKHIKKQISFVSYVDASYSYKRVKKLPDPIHHVLGREFISKKRYIGISFCDKSGVPVEGLLIPKTALQTAKVSKKVERILKSLESGTTISVEWEDIVRFRENGVPYEISKVYTEGILFVITNGFIIIDDPETLIFSPGQMPRNHPEKKAKRYYIPLTLIKNITRYAND